MVHFFIGHDRGCRKLSFPVDHRKTNVCYIYLQYKSKEQLLVWRKKANAWYIFEVSKQMTATCLGDLHEKSSRPSVGVGDVPRQRTMMRPIKGISFQVGKVATSMLQMMNAEENISPINLNSLDAQFLSR